jgi:hypothetical protein
MRKVVLLSSFGVVGLFLAWAATAQAGPLNLQEVAADTKWAAHLDVDALRASSLAQKARQEVMDKIPHAEDHLRMLAEIAKFNPGTDLSSITIYGKQVKRRTGVAIVHAKVDQKFLLDKAALAPGHQTTTYGKYELHSWTQGLGTKHERTMTGAFYKPDTMVFAASVDEVKAALDVLDGTKPSFAGKETGLTLSVPTGTILMVGEVGLTPEDLPRKSALVKKADAIVLAIGQEGANVFVVGQLLAKDDQTSGEIKMVLDGALALAKILKSDDAGLMKMVNSVHATVAGKTVNVEWRAPADDVWCSLQKAVAEAKKVRDQWHQRVKP